MPASVTPAILAQWMAPFQPVFTRPTWQNLLVLVAGAILAPGRRTVTSALSIMGLRETTSFTNFHRVLNRNRWSGRATARCLLTLLVTAFAPNRPVVIGIDETIERRWGPKIKARGIYRDPVRSSKEHFVKTSGLRWVTLQLLAPIPWVQRVWALPFFSVLAPSERYHQQRGKRHKKVHDWGRQLIVQLRRWLPERSLVVVADSTYAVIELLAACGRLPVPVTMVSRLRLDAALYDPAPPRHPGKVGRPHVKGARQPTLAQRLKNPQTAWQRVTVRWYGGRRREVEVASGTAVWYHSGHPPVPLRWVLIRDPKGRFEPQALLCTDVVAPAVQIVEWFVLRWQLEVTFHEGRTHLGIETQRQWSERAIARTTPVLLALFSLVTLCAAACMGGATLPVRCTAWYHKTTPTFADTLAFVRQQVWPSVLFSMSPDRNDVVEIPRAVFQHVTDTLAFAA